MSVLDFTLSAAGRADLNAGVSMATIDMTTSFFRARQRRAGHRSALPETGPVHRVLRRRNPQRAWGARPQRRPAPSASSDPNPAPAPRDNARPTPAHRIGGRPWRRGRAAGPPPSGTASAFGTESLGMYEAQAGIWNRMASRIAITASAFQILAPTFGYAHRCCRRRWRTDSPARCCCR